MDPQATIYTMEVLEAKPIDELTTAVTIKVCYVSDKPNPNNTVISKEVGKEIAATLPGAPVAGFFNKEEGDFEEHSRRITFKDGEFEIEDITRPYGFVCPVTAPWYQDFEENGETRTYLMCKAYLWTRQYEEATQAIDKGQSMELDEYNMSGYYEGKVFVFTSATLDKLCILGDAYAPCFSGAKIMANYAKQYNSLAEQLENTIGRRYYVMGNQLVQKPEGPITLKYALELGWNLTDAVYNQLAARGAEHKYWVKGIYTESGTIFAILEDRETMELVRCDVVITAQDTVELGTEMTQVTMTWRPAGPAEPEPVENLAGSNGIPEGGAAPVAVNQYADNGDDDDDKCPDCGKDPCECDDDEDDKADNTKHSKKGAKKEKTPDYQTMYNVAVARNLKLEEKITGFTAQVAKDAETISALNTTLASYQAQAEAAALAAKEAIVTEYSAMLTEDEVKSVKDFAATATAEQVEAKCAILFSKRAKAAPTQFQLNLAGVETPGANLPEFMRQALEFDKEDPLLLK